VVQIRRLAPVGAKSDGGSRPCAEVHRDWPTALIGGKRKAVSIADKGGLEQICRHPEEIAPDFCAG